MRPLHLVHAVDPASVRGIDVSVGIGSTASELLVRFEVRGSEPFVNPDLPRGESQWGLWNWDVVEVFVQAPDSSRYFEFQISPLGQQFELEIRKPREDMDRTYRSGFQARAQRSAEDRWEATFRIPWAALGQADGAPAVIRGNAFAILGEGSRRSYWSLFTPPQSSPDFHIPAHFQQLLPLR